MGLPTLRGIEHVGFTVPCLDEAERFLVDVLGCHRVYTAGPVLPQGTRMRDQLNVHEQAVVREWRMFRCGQGPNLEVFEYETPEGQNPQPRNSDIGGHHLAFYVDDFEAGLAHLRAHGVRVLGEPSRSAGPAEGQTWVYFLAPWGMQFELVSFPNGKAYEAHSPLQLWAPAAGGSPVPGSGSGGEAPRTPVCSH